MNGLYAYLNKQSQFCLQQLLEYQQSADAEAMHQFRVSLKKIHAGVVFLQQQHPSIKKQKKRIKTVFRSGGHIREQQLRLHWLRRQRLGVLIEAAGLEDTLNLYQANFSNDLPAFKKQLEKAFSKLFAAAKSIHKDELRQYVSALKTSITVLLVNHRVEEWHELRKQIKQLLYALRWLQPEEQVRVLRIQQINYLEQLQEAIGAWHDLVDLKQWLTDQQFFLYEDAKVRQAFGKGWNRVQERLAVQQKTVAQLIVQHRSRLSH